MKMIFVTLLAAMILLILVTLLIPKSKEGEYSKEIRSVLWMAFLVLVFYLFFIMTQSIEWAIVYNGLKLTCLTCLEVTMLQFVVKYTNTSFFSDRFMKGMWGATFALALLFFENNFYQNVFTVKMHTSGVHSTSYWEITYSYPAIAHTFFCYFMASLMIYILIDKVRSSASYYHKMYQRILIQILLTAFVNIYGLFADFKYDYSLMLYGINTIVLFYNTLYAVPKGLIGDSLKNLVEDLSNIIVCFDMTGKCIYANRMAMEVFQTDKNNFVEKVQIKYTFFEEKIKEDLEYSSWNQMVELNGEEHYYHIIYRLIKDAHGHYTAHGFRLDDRTNERKQLLEREMEAKYDKLTGLYRREYFFKRVQEIIEKNPEKPRYMICTNIKNFKLVNDLFGEEMGDNVLKEQARLLKFADYEDSVHGRINADRFAMLIDKESFKPELAARNTERVQVLMKDNNYKLHIYIGVYEITDPMESPKIMYDKANMAIAALRGDYQRIVAYYDQRMMEQLVHEKWVLSDFDSAIEEKQFFMELQPQATAQGKIVGAEALVRWKHPIRGILHPGSFVEIYEKTDIVAKMDYEIWEQAVKQLSVWNDSYMQQFAISVNICPRDFYYLDLYSCFTELVEKYGVSPKRLNLEITESLFMSDVETHQKTINELHAYGFQIEIDDFGSGYSSLNMLKDIPADILKLDMGFLKKTKNEKRGDIILESVIAMAKRLGMRVIVEGVQEEEQVERLQKMGCDMYQGFHFSKPVSVKEFERMCKTKNKLF